MNIDEITGIILSGQTARDVQTDVGPSEIGGCPRRVWHRLQGTPVTNPDTLQLAARMGTAIHAWIEKQFTRHDPFGERFLLETEVEAFGIRGHVDCFDTHLGEVIDWKTTTKKNLSRFPSAQQRTQVQLYGLLMEANGFPVNDVSLVCIARDGNERDIRVHSEPFDRSVGEAGLAWLEGVKRGKPDPVERVSFCRDYCPFYDASGAIGCEGGA